MFSFRRQNKGLLKLCENICSSTHPSKNHWLKVEELASEALSDVRLSVGSVQRHNASRSHPGQPPAVEELFHSGRPVGHVAAASWQYQI